jgi:hypothetical protein
LEARRAIVAIGLGCVFLTAACFKAYAYFSDSLQPLFYVLSPKWQILLMEGECLLGLWLISGFYRRPALVAALVTFVTFSAVNFFLGVLGRPSCGCFGNVQVNPWYVFTLDLLAVIAIIYSRPWEGLLQGVRGFGLPKALCGLAVSLLLFTGSGLAFLSPSFGRLLAIWRGESVEVKPAVSFLGQIPRGTAQEFSVTITNHGNHPVRIIGGSADCRCHVQGLPVVLDPGETRQIGVIAPFGGSPGTIQKPFRFFTDDPGCPYVSAWVSAYVVDMSAP